MANDNLNSKTISEIVALLGPYITAESDGSLRVNESGMFAWLSEQFGYYTASGTSGQIKDGAAMTIIQELKTKINREYWTSNPNWPVFGNNTSENTKARLLSIKNALVTEAWGIEAPYKEVEASMLAMANNLFNQYVVPTFPAGEEIITENRVYVETFVTDRGEESAPSPASNLIELDQNDTVTLACGTPPPGRHITHRRIYRSATGTQSSAYKLQGEYPIATTSVTDSKKTELLEEAIKTIGWLEPPAGLRGLTGLANGMMLGFVGRTLHASEPYHPYAYPAKYDKPLAYDIVGIVGIGSMAFIGTVGYPYVVSGADAQSLTEERINSRVPCASEPSMVAIENSVIYASPDGLALYENGRVEVLTSALFDRETWQAYNPSTMRAAEFDGIYYAFYTKQDETRGCFAFDIKAKAFGDVDQVADAVYANEDGIYILDGTAVKNFMPASGANRDGAWYSKTFRLGREQSFGWLQVDAEFPGTVTIRLYKDGVLHKTFAATSGEPMRNKPGTGLEWRIEVESNIDINGIVLATLTEELKEAV